MSEKDEKAPGIGADDLFVPLGNLAGKSVAHLREVLDRGDPVVMQNYEDLVEEFIKCFNHAVTQGVPPEWAMFAFTQAYAITMGSCLRANLHPTEAAKCLGIIIKNAEISRDLVQQVTVIVPPGGRTQ